MQKDGKEIYIPSIRQVENEVKRMRSRGRYIFAFRKIVYTMVVVAAVVILISMLWLPFLQIYGKSMAPTLEDGEVICCRKTTNFQVGDIVAFYYNNKILVKRVIGNAGDWIDIKKDGTVYVNQAPIDEPYLADKALGECDIELPYQVPDGKIFVMGDHRSTSVDSRNTSIGCIPREQVVGEIMIRIWPLKRFCIF